ncbi:MAG: PQQ-binding-like beta-propeller repeat protein [Opitutaceae bacterium]
MLSSVRLPLIALLLALGAGRVAAEEWPEFRGPSGQGISTAPAVPLTWSKTENILWRTSVPGLGWSSPVVGGGRIFLTTGVADAEGAPSLRVLALDLASGRMLWDVEVFAPGEAGRASMHKKNSPASPTPVLRDGRLYVHFGHFGTAGLDVQGKILWRNNRLRYEPEHGNGGSPIIVGDLLVFSADARTDPALVALDRRTGELAWRAPRDLEVRQKFSFATPLLIEIGGRPQIVCPASGAVIAHDPADGREIWRVRYGGGYSLIPRPVFAHGLLFIGTGYNRADLLAIRVDGATGDLTDTHIAWRTTKGAPLTPSTGVVGDELYAVSDMGVATCFDARTGTVHWQEKLEAGYSASPLAAAGRVYFQSESGVSTVVAAGKEFRRLAQNALGERTLASLAVAEGTFLLRSENALYRIGRGGASTGR